MKVVTASAMRAIEEQVVKRGTSLDALMERAGSAVARVVADDSGKQDVLVLVGPGNNGGDGLIAASRLLSEGHEVVIYMYRRTSIDPYSGPAIAAESDEDLAELTALARRCSVVVDALLGIGQTRPPDAGLSRLLACVNRERTAASRAVAVDIPTGVNADTGAVPGEAFRATLTVAMGFLKVGNVVFPGAEYCGEIRVEDVGIPAQLAKSVQVSVPTDGDIASLLPTRSATSNKGSGGRLLVIGGSRDFVGAPALASLAAYRAGAGLVEVAVPESIEPTVGGHILEAIYRPLQEEDGQIAPDAIAAVETGMERAAALALGPGMGLSSSTVQFTQAVLRALAKAPPKHALIDADGLNALSKLGEWWKTKTPIVLTPHPGEMSRLTGLPIAEIQSDRLGVARRYAAEWEKIVVLKGAGTVVADPSGEAVVNPTGGPNLATAGTGDVLSGVIGGLLAQGVRPFPAAVAGVYIHGRAGDLLRAEHGDVGTLAGDLLGMLPRARLSILANTQEAL